MKKIVLLERQRCPKWGFYMGQVEASWDFLYCHRAGKVVESPAGCRQAHNIRRSYTPVLSYLEKKMMVWERDFRTPRAGEAPQTPIVGTVAWANAGSRLQGCRIVGVLSDSRVLR